MIETPQRVETPAQELVALHIETPRTQMQHLMQPGTGETMAALKAQCIGPAGPWLAHHLKVTPRVFDFDICVPVSAPVAAIGRESSPDPADRRTELSRALADIGGRS